MRRDAVLSKGMGHVENGGLFLGKGEIHRRLLYAEMNGCLIKNYFRTIAKGGWGEGLCVA